MKHASFFLSALLCVSAAYSQPSLVGKTYVERRSKVEALTKPILSCMLAKTSAKSMSAWGAYDAASSDAPVVRGISRAQLRDTPARPPVPKPRLSIEEAAELLVADCGGTSPWRQEFARIQKIKFNPDPITELPIPQAAAWLAEQHYRNHVLDSEHFRDAYARVASQRMADQEAAIEREYRQAERIKESQRRWLSGASQ